MRRTLPALLCALSMGSLWSCGGQKLDVKGIAPTANPVEQTTQLDHNMNKARNEKVNVLSPNWFAQADRSLHQAKLLSKKGRNTSSILSIVARGHAQLRRAEEKALITRKTVPLAIQARDDARAAGATAYENEYADAEDEFLDLTKDAENTRISSAQRNEKNVVAIFRNLELRAIKQNLLGKVRQLIGEAEQNGAKRLAPASLTEASEKYHEADTFISQHRHQKEQTLQKANEALFHANRLNQIVEQSALLESMTPEQNAVRMEKLLARISEKAQTPDMRDQSFTTQVRNIEESIASIQRDREFLADISQSQQKEIESLQKKVASLEGASKTEGEAKAKLEAEKKLNETYGAVRSYFNRAEADVYKEEDRLLIRLHAMAFPVGQAVILPQNYSLLSKVQKAIRTFGEPRVTIEGHTDSTGSDARNELLSEERAESVRQYFIANHTLAENMILAVGYGSGRPVASNKTGKGRAQNRRIDVVIQPQKTTHK